ncbi:hypothetical protein QBC35DRAFT_508282 [Podospora australis]|uniref:DUF6594 domain-containing protein n=1 Tax=Podospora australis TaxID=1536484 RepID=A0AAN6WJY7_9PEZI|nr:hypothetical protein QBC35DRAFT_508282 [Podospora australis]
MIASPGGFSTGFFPWFHEKIGQKLKKQSPDSVLGENIYSYDTSLLNGIAETIITVTAALLPATSIVVLSRLREEKYKDQMTAAFALFSTAFAIALATMTKARRIEVFIATAVFAAVNVALFVGV